MQETNEMSDRLINEFAKNYMEKLFYFCLKKTSSHIEAEDLTQDIALQIITALNKGTIPTSFSAWIWQIARNRYSVWAKEKHNQNESVTGSDIGDYEIEDKSENILDEMIHTEQMALLRLALQLGFQVRVHFDRDALGHFLCFAHLFVLSKLRVLEIHP